MTNRRESREFTPFIGSQAAQAAQSAQAAQAAAAPAVQAVQAAQQAQGVPAAQAPTMQEMFLVLMQQMQQTTELVRQQQAMFTKILEDRVSAGTGSAHALRAAEEARRAANDTRLALLDRSLIATPASPPAPQPGGSKGEVLANQSVEVMIPNATHNGSINCHVDEVLTAERRRHIAQATDAQTANNITQAHLATAGVPRAAAFFSIQFTGIFDVLRSHYTARNLIDMSNSRSASEKEQNSLQKLFAANVKTFTAHLDEFFRQLQPPPFIASDSARAIRSNYPGGNSPWQISSVPDDKTRLSAAVPSRIINILAAICQYVDNNSIRVSVADPCVQLLAIVDTILTPTSLMQLFPDAAVRTTLEEVKSGHSLAHGLIRLALGSLWHRSSDPLTSLAYQLLAQLEFPLNHNQHANVVEYCTLGLVRRFIYNLRVFVYLGINEATVVERAINIMPRALHTIPGISSIRTIQAMDQCFTTARPPLPTAFPSDMPSLAAPVVHHAPPVTATTAQQNATPKGGGGKAQSASATKKAATREVDDKGRTLIRHSKCGTKHALLKAGGICPARANDKQDSNSPTPQENGSKSASGGPTLAPADTTNAGTTQSAPSTLKPPISAPAPPTGGEQPATRQGK